MLILFHVTFPLLALLGPYAGASAAPTGYRIVSEAGDDDVAGTSSTSKSTGQAALTPAFVQHLKRTAGMNPFKNDSGGIMAQTIFLTETSPLHVDSLPAVRGRRAPVPFGDEVGLFPATTNPDAHFDVVDTCVPIKEGELIVFNGGSPHRTVVNGGSVTFIGPFHLKSMEAVGVTDRSSDLPSDVPSHVPSSSPMDDPSLVPSYGPSHVPSSSPTDEPSVVPSDVSS